MGIRRRAIVSLITENGYRLPCGRRGKHMSGSTDGEMGRENASPAERMD